MKCPLCNCYLSIFKLKSDQREYWFCQKCCLVFVPPKFFIPREEEVKRYLEHENSLGNEGYVKMFQEKINTMKKICPGTSTVMDYGCGYEPVLKSLLEREGYQVNAYDPNFFPNGDSRKEYDLLISTETFEHFKKPREELTRLIPKISNRGYLVVMTRFYPEKKNALCLDSFSKWYYKRDPTHVAFYGQKTFSWIAEEFGMKICHNNKVDFIILQKK